MLCLRARATSGAMGGTYLASSSPGSTRVLLELVSDGRVDPDGT